MAVRVTKEDQVSLNGKFYKLAQAVSPALINQYAPKVVTGGDTTSDSQQRRSSLRWSDHRGGIGKDRITDLEISRGHHLDRSWYSNAWIRHSGHLTLPPLATTTAASGVSGVVQVGAIAEVNNTIFASFGTSLREYSYSADTWTERHTLPSTANMAITFRLAGTVYIAFATSGTGGGYSYAAEGDTTSWTNDVKDAEYLAFWDDRLWGIDATGQLWFATTIGTETNDARLPTEDNNVTGLHVERDSAGEPILYASTKTGLWAHDAANARFVKTELDTPFHNDAGLLTKRWRGKTYFPAGLSIYEYAPGPTATISTMGPDRDDGLPSERKGTIVGIDASHNHLFALVDSTSAAAEEFDMFVDGGIADPEIMETAVGVSGILGWDGNGWGVIWESGSSEEAITSSLVSYAYSGYRFWWGQNRRVHYITLPVDIINPNETSDFEYAASATHDFPWLMVGQETNGLVLRLRVEVANASSNETVQAQYALDFDDSSFTTLGSITSDGITTYEFPDSTTPTGTAFRAIRIRLNLARGSDVENSPDVIAVNLEWRKKLPAQYGWSVMLDLTETYSGRSPQQQRADIVTAMESNTLVEFTYRDDTGNDRNFYVDIVNMSGAEFTGHNETGKVALQLAEV